MNEINILKAILIIIFTYFVGSPLLSDNNRFFNINFVPYSHFYEKGIYQIESLDYCLNDPGDQLIIPTYELLIKMKVNFENESTLCKNNDLNSFHSVSPSENNRHDKLESIIDVLPIKEKKDFPSKDTSPSIAPVSDPPPPTGLSVNIDDHEDAIEKKRPATPGVRGVSVSGGSFH